MIAEFSSFFFATFGLVLSCILYELRVRARNLSLAADVALVYNLFCTLFLIISLFTRYDLWLRWCISVRRYSKMDTFVTTGLWKNLLFECLINIVAPYHFFDGIKYVEYSKDYEMDIVYEVNDLLLFFMFFRLYLVCRFLFYLSHFMNPRTQRVCAIHGCDADAIFALKGILQQNPFPVLLSALGVSIVVLGYMLRLFESPLSEASGQDFTSMNNCMWNMVITLTSAGYGELYPKTFFGRIIGVTICLWGVLIISLMVVAVTQTLEFDYNEERSYNLLIRLEYK